MLRSLLDLVDLVSSLITRVDFSIPGKDVVVVGSQLENEFEGTDFASSSYLDQATASGASYGNAPVHSNSPTHISLSSDSTRLSGIGAASVLVDTNPFSNSRPLSENISSTSTSTVVSRSMYMLRRMGDRKQTLLAVQQLLAKLAEIEATGSRAQIKEMRDASALQTLLSALSHSTDWPDVELLIAKAICVLVPVEEDVSLLLKNALEILNALFVFQLKSAEQMPGNVFTRSDSDPGGTEKLFNPSQSTTTSFLHDTASPKVSPSREVTSGSSSSTVSDQNRSLVAEALAKLIYVLCCEWKKQDVSAIAASNGIRLNTSISMNIGGSGLQSTNASVSGSDGGRTRPRSLSASLAPLVDANQTQVQVLTVIMLVCDKYKTRYIGLLPEPPSPSSRQRKVMLESMNMRTNAPSGSDLSSSYVSSTDKTTIFLADNSIDLTSLEGSIIDDTAIVVSGALCYLAEMPQCRPALVAHGVLRLLRIWIEAGGQLLLDLKQRLFEEAAVRSVEENRILDRLSDLLCNSTRAMMFILGGSLDSDLTRAPNESQFSAQNNNSTKIASGQSNKNNVAVAILNRSDSLNRQKNGSIQFVGYEYMVGRIDADLLSEDIPSVLVRFVATIASVLSYDEINKTIRGETTSGSSRFGSVLAKMKHLAFSKQIVLHLAQSLFQLSSRGQNRPHLLAIDAPHAIFSLLWDAVVEIRAGMSGNDRAEEELERQSALFRVAANDDFMDDYSESRARSRLRSKCHLSTFPFTNSSWHDFKQELPLPSEQASTQQPLKNRTQINCDHFIRAVAQYCLDSISLFVSDSFNQVPPSLFPVPGNVSGVGVGVNVSTKTVSMLLNNNTVRNFMDESTDSKVFVVSTGNSIVDMLSNAKIMETFKYVLTTFPRGRARLSALKIISSLTDWRECIHSLHQADIIDALVVICFESEKQSASNDPVSLLFPTTAKSSASNLPSLTNQQNLQAAAAPVIVPAVKRTSGFGPLSLLRRSRDTSAPASSSMIPPRPKIERGTTISGTVSNHAAATNSLFGERPRLNRHVTDGESDVSSTSSFHSNNKAAGQATRSVLFHSNLQEFPNSGSSDTEGLFDDEFLSTANEETLTVTYALANICHARPLYAKLLLNNGLLEIMLGLYNVRNLDDVNRQVLRCISAMCPYLGKDLNQVELLAILDEPKPSITRQRNAVLMDTLVILSKALQSSSILLQREAIIGLAGLSNNPLLHKDILVGPLRHVVSIVLARDCIDQPTRSAAESILKNLGFSGGLQDIELVGYDLDVLRDWYLLRELLDPQEAALVVLRCWIADLFEGTNYSQLYNMPRSPGRAFDNAFATSAPNLYRAHSNPVVASPEKRNLIAKGFGKHSSSFSGDLNLSAGRPSFNGSLHYTSEDESTLDGSVSSPAVLDLAGNDTRKSRDEKSSPRVQARRSFEGRSDQGVSPSDVGVAASDTIGVHERTSTTDSNEGSTGNTRRKLFLPFIRKPASAERNTSDQPFSSPARGSQPTTARGSKLFKIAPSPRQFAEGLRRLVPYFLSGKSKTAASTSSQTNNPVNAVEEDDTTGSYCHDILGAFGSLTSRANSNEHDNAHSYSFFARNFSSLKSNNSSGMDETNFGLDLPPMGVLDLLDLYYPSKMHHATFMDLTSLYNEDVLVSDFSRDRALDHTASVQELMLALPTPHSVYGIGFQPRQYSFSRIRRVVERMIEEGGPAKRWSLAFLDNSFAPEGLTEFHSSLMQMLCKCPEIISLSFALSPNSSRKMPDQSGHLGHMAGSVPPNVRFINFRGVLSSESIQSLCILLRKNNFIYTFQGSDSDYPCGGHRSPSTSQHQRTALEAALLGAIPSSPGANRRTPPTSRRPSTVPDDDKCIHTSDDQSSSNPRDYHRTPLKPSKGLLGLAITHTSFTSADIKYLIELLAISPNKLNRQPKATREDGLYSTTPRGIRFLDLSYNKLGDSLCADILTASTKSPLEGLDLSGNIIHRGKDFCDILLKVLSPLNGISYLRYLGLSNNALQNTTVCQILDILQTNEQLTSLDLSCNDIQHSKRLEVSLRSCIKSNRGLRLLDLSFNKLNAVLVKHVYLGLLENECLLMMPLAGNMLAAQAPDLPLIQEELTKNRQRYREKLDAYNDNIRRSKALMFDMISLQDPRSARRNSNSNTQFGVSGPVSLSDTRSLNESQEKMYCVSESSEVDISQPIIASKVNTILQEAVHVALHSSDSPVLESRQTTPLPLAQEVSSNENFDGNSATILPVLLPVLIGNSTIFSNIFFQNSLLIVFASQDPMVLTQLHLSLHNQ